MVKFFDIQKFYAAISIVAMFLTLNVSAKNHVGVAEFELVVEPVDASILKFDGTNPIVVDPAWFGLHEDEEFRVKVLDESDNILYMQCGVGAWEMYWEPLFAGKYRLTLQKKINGEWVATEYTRTVVVNGLRKVTAEDIELDFSSIKTTNIAETVCSLDICSGTRMAKHSELIMYDESWFSSTGAGCVCIMENGSRIAQENGKGEYVWTPKEKGLYTLQHRTYVDGYLQDEVYSATFIVEEIEMVPPVLSGVSVAQRYPWNGLVDVKCVLEGGANQNYNVAFVVNDEAGGTNIPAQTFWQIGGNTTNNVLTVRPGKLHFVWDANADIAEDGEFPAVSITVKAEPAVDVTEVKVLNNAN